ncbi:MAG: glycosyltransferase, partial [Desulfovibrio sp.]|nr:glycosyltransferase [Desulfovibrio sp.]
MEQGQAIDIFRFLDRNRSEAPQEEEAQPCDFVWQGDALYLPQSKVFWLDTIQLSPLAVKSLKKTHGDTLTLAMHFAGKILVKAGVDADGKSFAWCGEELLTASPQGYGTVAFDLRRVEDGILKIRISALEESLIYQDQLQNAEPTALDPDKILYDFSFPTYELCCEEPLYCKVSHDTSFFSFEERCVHLQPKTTADCLTYFNAFSACKWQKYTNVEHLSVYVDFQGKGIAEIFHFHEHGQEILASWKVQAAQRTTFVLPLGSYPEDGILGLRLHAEEESTLYGGGYLTDDPVTQPVRLGIAITTFKREKAVTAAIARLGQAIAGHALYHDRISLTVVDNGQTLEAKDVPSATLLPNRNLGGTGGFMRGMIHYQDAGDFTHCLFMDDDASCEAGSIFRAMSFLRHAQDPATAICGSMLSADVQFMQWECGAWFDKRCYPLHHQYDLRDIQMLVQNEITQEKIEKPIYGAWWFFMFPLAQVQQYVFPFFVRGDDIEFSYTNHFSMMSLNGVGIWQEDFKCKESPMTLYLDIRSHVIHHILLKNLDHSRRTILQMVWRFFNKYNKSYQYDTANAIATSFHDVLTGINYWLKNMDMSKIRNNFSKKYII